MTDTYRAKGISPESRMKALERPPTTRYAADVAREVGDDRTESQMRTIRSYDRGSRYDIVRSRYSKRSVGRKNGRRSISRGRNRR